MLPCVTEYTKGHSPGKAALPFVLVLFGLFLSGYPETHAEWSNLYRPLLDLGSAIFPGGSEIWRTWPTIGTSLVVLGIMLSPLFQELLSHPRVMWLGGLSLPIYLLHGPLLRTVLTWMLFGFTRPAQYSSTNEQGETNTWESIPVPKSMLTYIMVLPLFFTMLLTLCHLWNLYVDPWCAWATKRLEAIMCGEEQAANRV